jgi:ubiquitin C-terminal hydrolase
MYNEGLKFCLSFFFAQPQNRGQSQKSYTLVACVFHHGEGQGTNAGHYTAIGLRNGQWWHFDDASTIAINGPSERAPVSEDSTVTRLHLAFYQQCDGSGDGSSSGD